MVTQIQLIIVQAIGMLAFGLTVAYIVHRRLKRKRRG